MQLKSHIPPDAAELRRAAEARLREQLPRRGANPTEAGTQRLVHELQVHQVELEMQNEQLQYARNELETGLEKYSDLYDFAPVGYLTLDREGTILEANLTAASLLGMERACLVKRRLGRSVSAVDLPVLAAFLTKVFESKVNQACDVTLLNEGKPSVEVRIRATVAASGRECRAALTDITERKRAEMDRLILSKLESTGILAGGIAHDFNNLLTIILLDLELLRELHPPFGESARLLEEAKDTALAASALTRQFITLSQGGSPVRKPTRLSDVIKASVRPALSGSSVRYELLLPDDLWLAEVDEGQIGQVIQNLVLNAREAMPQGGMVSVRAENVFLGAHDNPALTSGDYVRVNIADRGCGIAKEVMPKIFDPYFSTKQRGDQKGMGLGLTICHAVIQKHGGAIAVESEVGVGTTIQIHIPACGQLLGEQEPPLAPIEHQPGKILVMDDEEDLREVVGLWLQRMGHEVALVAEGGRAVEVYGEAKRQGRPFDAVILDLTVRAGLGGREALQALLKIDPAVRAIVMSGTPMTPRSSILIVTGSWVCCRNLLKATRYAR